MAQSRLERIGTIYSRVTNLVKGGILKQEELPIWYQVYKAFPPKYEPCYDRPGSQVPVKNIFYPEDVIRSKFQQEFANTLYSNLTSSKPSRTQQFIEVYRRLEKDGTPTPELYDKAKEEFISMIGNSQERTQTSLTPKVKKVRSGIDVKLFLEEST